MSVYNSTASDYDNLIYCANYLIQSSFTGNCLFRWFIGYSSFKASTSENGRAMALALSLCFIN